MYVYLCTCVAFIYTGVSLQNNEEIVLLTATVEVRNNSVQLVKVHSVILYKCTCTLRRKLAVLLYIAVFVIHTCLVSKKKNVKFIFLGVFF